MATKSPLKPVQKKIPWRRRTTLLLLGVLGVSLLLNGMGLRWGLPNYYGWCNDSIAGLTSVFQRERLLETWVHHYPRMQFLVNGLAYEPLLRAWAEAPPDRGGPDIRPDALSYNLDLRRGSILVFSSFVLTALMGTGAVLAVFLAGRALFRDDLAAFLAALALACVAEFVFYSHTGNVDVPAVFWYSWALYCAIRAGQARKLRYFFGAGLFSALGVGSKDPTIGFVIGLGLALCVLELGRARKAGKSWPTAVFSLLGPGLLTFFVIFVLVFGILNNFFTNPQAFFQRMSGWGNDSPTMQTYVMVKNSLDGQITLLGITGKALYFAMGWPLLIMITAGLIRHIRRQRVVLWFTLLPMLVYYLVVIMRIGFSYPRFFLPGIAGLALLAGSAGAAWWRWARIPKLARAGVLLGLFGLTFLYALGSDLEMVRDSRYRTIAWFERNVPRETTVATLMPQSYGPNLKAAGFKNYLYPWQPSAGTFRPEALPPYLVVCTRGLLWGPAEPFFRELRAGRTPYREVESYGRLYLYPKASIFAVAAWGVENIRQPNPPIVIYALSGAPRI